jgi:erythromycin esterase
MSVSFTHTPDVVTRLQNVSYKLENNKDLDPLLEQIGDARFVLLGEASHGTHDYYTWRTHISKRLIAEKNFTMIAVEGDWPDCYLLNRYIKGYPDAGEMARDVLKNFNRWPTWMWANWEINALAEWMRSFNFSKPINKRVGFYGLDVYSLWESMETLFNYLKEKDPVALVAVKKAMDCFEPFNVKEGFSYAENFYGLSQNCQKEVKDLLVKIRQRMPLYNTDEEAVFSAEQNALVISNAEQYYHHMLSGGEITWNIRDRHMTETAERLLKFGGDDAKIIIWEHNTHIGDARATDMRRSGLINIGQLIKEKHESEGVYRVGFGSYEGTVLAGSHWGAKVEKMKVPKAKEGSWEHLLHMAGAYNKIIFSKDIQNFSSPIGHRAIGVVYDPDFEHGNYVPSVIPLRYEAFIYLNTTQALHSLHVKPDGDQMPESYPWGV